MMSIVPTSCRYRSARMNVFSVGGHPLLTALKSDRLARYNLLYSSFYLRNDFLRRFIQLGDAMDDIGLKLRRQLTQNL